MMLALLIKTLRCGVERSARILCAALPTLVSAVSAPTLLWLGPVMTNTPLST